LEFAGDGRLDMRSFMMGDLVEEVFERVRSHDACRGLRVRSEGNLDIRVEGDRQALRRLIMNMAMNTADHRPDGQFVICVRDIGDGEMLVQLSDDGPGISLADRNRVFDPFYTTKRAGTGLGLAIVKRTVERHGGKISVGDSPQGGARFEIRIPTKAVSEDVFAEAA
jgi:signal transduction histidine kinase